VDAEQITLLTLHKLVGKVLRILEKFRLLKKIIREVNQVAAHHLFENRFPVAAGELIAPLVRELVSIQFFLWRKGRHH
jgi:hypothetical protein